MASSCFLFKERITTEVYLIICLCDYCEQTQTHTSTTTIGRKWNVEAINLTAAASEGAKNFSPEILVPT
jgi:hypothetical protein